MSLSRIFLMGSIWLVLSECGKAAITIGSPTTQWQAVVYANPNSADPANDHQTGISEGDIVGNAANAAFYTQFDNGGTAANLTDGEIAFRMRLAADSNPGGLNVVVWVGIDANVDGKIDLFAGAFEGNTIGLYPAGTGTNTSPSTTSIVSSSPYFQTAVTTLNFNFAPVTTTINPGVTNTNLDGGSGGGANHTDQFVSMKFNFNTLVSAIAGMTFPGAATFNENSPLRYIVATSNQKNTLNQDLNGINGSVNSTATFGDLGVFTPVYSGNGTVVAIPEVSAAWLCQIPLIGLLWRWRRPRLLATAPRTADPKGASPL